MGIKSSMIILINWLTYIWFKTVLYVYFQYCIYKTKTSSHQVPNTLNGKVFHKYSPKTPDLVHTWWVSPPHQYIFVVFGYFLTKYFRKKYLIFWIVSIFISLVNFFLMYSLVQQDQSYRFLTGSFRLWFCVWWTGTSQISFWSFRHTIYSCKYV